MKVLLATDGSSDAIEAAKFLSRLPHREPLELSVVTVIAYPTLHPADLDSDWPNEFWEQLQATAKTTLDEITPIFAGANVTLTQKILEGHAGHSIVKEAKATETDLIVLGAKGHSVISRIVLGSVSDHVATHANCSVLVIRPSNEGRESSRFSTAIAYDGSKNSEFALRQYTQFGWGPSTETQVLTVVPIVRFFGSDILPETLNHRAEQHQIAAKATEHAVQQITSVGAKVTSTVIEAEHIGESIVDFTEINECDLVVVGDTGFSGITRMLLGSVSRYVLRHAGCSVWLARDEAT